MEKFPEIKEGQAVLMRAESGTGHVLDELFNLALTGDQKVFTIFDSVEAALESAKKNLNAKNKSVDCTVFGRNQTVIYYLNPNLMT